MGTKNNPGSFDCYANAEPDEPMFVLLGRDPAAALTVRFWIVLRRVMGENDQSAKLTEALVCSQSMAKWADGLGKNDRVCVAISKLSETCRTFLEDVLG